ncbi:MAG: serine/threonine protein kinase [Deltaproteobacteria bacterium]|nr:serine/threonine protein kinase [Deltaproteobacteria bacterium]
MEETRLLSCVPPVDTGRGAAGEEPGGSADVTDQAAGGGADEGAPPERVGRYRIVAEIGRGGMAVVYRACLDGPRGFAKEVCLKRILPGAADDPAMVVMFEREARIAATLQHANVVQVFDFDLHDGAPFLVMELVDGPSLWQVFNAAVRSGRSVPVAVACGMVVQALHGLHHVHTRTLGGRPMGLVHRDVSLHNILLMRNGEVKVADFGIARATQLGERTRTGVLKGKLAYIAPEYVASGKADRRGDLFSVGVVLHELLAGVRRSPPATDAEGLGWVLHPELPPLAHVRPDAGDRLAAVVAAMTAALPDDRPADAAEAAERIAEAAAAAGTAEIARFVEALVPPGERSPHDPTLLAADGELGETIPTPSPFDPTATRTPTRAGEGTGRPPIRTELTPDASTAVADANARRRGRAAGRRRWIAAVGAAAALVATLLAWLALGERAVERPGEGERSSGGEASGRGEGKRAVERPGEGGRSSGGEASGRGEGDGGGAEEAGSDARRVETRAADASAEVARAPGGDGGTASEAGEEASAETVVSDAGEESVPDGGAGEVEASGRRNEGASGGRDGGTRPAAAEAGGTGARDGGASGVAGEGTLLVSVRPWAMVRIDDGEPEEVLARRFTVPAGRHRVRIDNDLNDCHFSRTVEVPAGGEAQVTENLIERGGALRGVDDGGGT